MSSVPLRVGVTGAVLLASVGLVAPPAIGQHGSSKTRDQLEQASSRRELRPVADPLETSNWWNGFADPGVDESWYSSMVIWDSSLVVGGWWNNFDGQPVNLLTWDGNSWAPLGGGLPNTLVYGLGVFEGDLVVSTDLGWPQDDSSHVARWDGSSWTAMDEGAPAGGYPFVVYRDSLYVGGCDGLYRWNGEAWDRVAVFDQCIEDMTVHGDSLVVIGRFDSINGMPANDYAVWDGDTWTPLGTAGANWHTRMTIASYEGDIVTGGWFSEIDGVSANGVARWNGMSWEPFGNLWDCHDLVVHDGDLYGVGYHIGVRRWTGAEWEPVGEAAQESGDVLASFGSELVVLGDFPRIGPVVARDFARWTGSEWLPFPSKGLGTNQPVFALGTYAGRLVAGGAFRVAGRTEAIGVALLEETEWIALGSGLDGTAQAIQQYGDDLVAGGTFSTAGEVPAANIARWDGNSWSPLAGGLDSTITALTVYESDLIAGGSFLTAGGDSVHGVARWDGVSWHPMGTGFNQPVYELAVYDGDLVAGGLFTTAGPESVHAVARWDGSNWKPLGKGLGGSVHALAVYGQDLIAGGNFGKICGEANVARWNGSSWEILGGGVCATHWDTQSYVADLTVLDGVLYATGTFVYAGLSNLRVENIAAWNGITWVPIEAGIDFCCGVGSAGYAVLGFEGNVYVGGGFFSTSGVGAYNMGRWTPDDSVPVTLLSFEALREAESVLLRWRTEEPGQTTFRVHRDDGDGMRQPLPGTILFDGVSYEYRDLSAPIQAADYWLAERNRDGTTAWHGPRHVVGSTGAKLRPILAQNLPNPFGESTEISFWVSAPGQARLRVFDVAGKLVAVVVDGQVPSGWNRARWDGMDRAGRAIPSGAYFYKLETPQGSASRKLVISRR